MKANIYVNPVIIWILNYRRQVQGENKEHADDVFFCLWTFVNADKFRITDPTMSQKLNVLI